MRKKLPLLRVLNLVSQDTKYRKHDIQYLFHCNGLLFSIVLFIVKQIGLIVKQIVKQIVPLQWISIVHYRRVQGPLDSMQIIEDCLVWLLFKEKLCI